MRTALFQEAFSKVFRQEDVSAPTYAFWDPIIVAKLDPCPDVPGMISIKKQRLLNLAFGLIPENEAYLEVGTFQGKSLISAMLGNPLRPAFACDNFTQFEGNTFATAQGHLERYGLLDKIQFYNCDFRDIYTPASLPVPVGLYFYDAGHDYQSQYLAIKLVERYLADEALVIVDDWRFAPDSQSRAKEATIAAAEESTHDWELLLDLPARFNGDRAMWWNGVGVLAFRRQKVDATAAPDAPQS
ncbi:MAG: class I SAM-dependent methyltransferase [Candidatus Schekmanbacteria bacterium]|nr:class I SAM-dependent methyltransferase [Candidatus Schekmanbacteria bacterium]